MSNVAAKSLAAECAQWGFPVSTINPDSVEEIHKIYKSLECPVCHEFPAPGIVYSCSKNRHMICQQCLPSSKICPACSSPIMTKEKNATVDRCIDNYLIPCKYKFDGCPHIVPGKNLREHLRSCSYRPIPCIMSRCEETVPFLQLFNHLKTVHAKKVNGINDSNTHIIEWWIEGDLLSTARWPPFYFTCFNNVFLYMCVSTIHGMWEWVWILASEEEALRFRVEARMENIDKLMGLEWRGPVHSIKKSVKDIISSGYVFVTNSKEIRNPFLFQKGTDGKSYWRTQVEIYQVSPPIPTSIPYLVTNDPGKHKVTKAKDNFVYTIGDDKSNQNIAKAASKVDFKPSDSNLSKNASSILIQNLEEDEDFNSEATKSELEFEINDIVDTASKMQIQKFEPSSMFKSDYSLRFDGDGSNSISNTKVNQPQPSGPALFKSDYSLRFDDDGMADDTTETTETDNGPEPPSNSRK